VKLGVVSDEEMPWRLQAHVTVNCAVDLCLLISRRELRLRPRGCPYARAPKGEAAYVVVVVTVSEYGPIAAYGVCQHPGTG
jgi:hypothetical protein